MPKYELGRIPTSPYYYITWTERGRSRRRSTRERDEQQAQLVLATFIIEKERKPQASPDDVAIAQVLEDYYDEHAVKIPSAEQARIAKAHLNRIFGLSRVSAFTPSAHALYEKTRRAEGVSHETINREMMVLRAAFNHARKYHGLLASPYVPTIAKSHPENKPSAPKGRPLSLDELARLFDQAHEQHEERFLMFLVGTMCRPDAAFDFQPKTQADFKHGVITLNPPERNQTKKVRPAVPMPNFLRKPLADSLKAGEMHFIEYHGHRIHSAKKAFRRMRAEAGLGADVNPYSIRHTLSREIRRRKVPGDQISIMLGHRPQNTSRTDLVYAPYEPGYCREARLAIEGVWRAITRKRRASKPIKRRARKLPNRKKAAKILA